MERIRPRDAIVALAIILFASFLTVAPALDFLHKHSLDALTALRWHVIGKKYELAERRIGRTSLAAGSSHFWIGWLIGEHRTSGEKKFYLANLPAETDLRTLAATIKARWICEQAHQQLKEKLGRDHFEGRSWRGLHRHALMTMIAYAFLQYRRLAALKRKKRISGPPPQPTLPAVWPSDEW